MENAPCKDCPDRVVEPNCHMTCEKYLAYRAKIDKAFEGKCIASGLDYYTARLIERERRRKVAHTWKPYRNTMD